MHPFDQALAAGVRSEQGGKPRLLGHPDHNGDIFAFQTIVHRQRGKSADESLSTQTYTAVTGGMPSLPSNRARSGKRGKWMSISTNVIRQVSSRSG